MKLINQQIYSYATNLINFNIEQRLPIKINFFLQKNIQMIVRAAEEIDRARIEVGEHYGVLNEETGAYQVPAEKLPAANQELNDLMLLEQDINLHIFKLDDFDGIELTYQQLSNIMFMIEE